MNNSSIVYFNGEYIEKNQVRIDPDDRGFLLSDGLYDVIRSYNGTLFMAEEHARRLNRGAKELRLDNTRIPDIIPIAEQLLDRNGLRQNGDAIVYFQVTRGAAPRSHAFPAGDTPLTVYAFARSFQPDEKGMKQGIKAVTVPDQRWGRCDIKTIALLPNTLAHQKARDAGAKEAIFVRNGAVQEGTHSNLFIVKNGILKTPPLTNHVLAGITRQAALSICMEMQIECHETLILIDDLYSSDEVMIAGTTSDITPVIQIDQKSIGEGYPGPITQKILYGYTVLARNIK